MVQDDDVFGGWTLEDNLVLAQKVKELDGLLNVIANSYIETQGMQRISLSLNTTID